MRPWPLGILLLLGLTLAQPAQLGPRPFFLLDRLEPGPLHQRLAACAARTEAYPRSPLAVGHRGAALFFPEHTREGYLAAVRQGAGFVECDAVPTADGALVCRHSDRDLAETTNILSTPLAAKCRKPFRPGRKPDCRTTDLTLAEFLSLEGWPEGRNEAARKPEDYYRAAPAWRTLAYAPGTVMSHRRYIELLKPTGVNFIPELKKADLPPGLSLEAYRRRIVDDYRELGVPPERVYLQSFDLEDLRYWRRYAPEYAKNAVWLDGRYKERGFDPAHPERLKPSMAALAAEGLRFLSPPLWVLLALDDDGRIVPSAYASAARAAGLELIPWTLERSGPLTGGGGWYYRSVRPAIRSDGDVYRVLDVLVNQIGVYAIFSDWPATVTFFDACGRR
ncbi:glycerophosphodiester phosphodiesterase family protein [Oceanithermus sp.]|uniref:glycerophosphodiester phosphodiesterase family protein n=1 Tax=Oceanithermus sp. TaxID=2268145 RepID=UPI002579E75E|nr:glycerophosphodiester phosphodiesterase family protein [Oceanithermus sp.]